MHFSYKGVDYYFLSELAAQINATDNEIDQRVFDLYGLTYDEVLIVDPETPITREEYEQTS